MANAVHLHALIQVPILNRYNKTITNSSCFGSRGTKTKVVIMNNEVRRIILSTICGGGVGALLILILENWVTADIRFLIPVICVMFVSARNSIFK